MYKNVAKLIGATSLSQFLPILILPILTSQLNLEVFGYLGSFISLVLIVSIFVTLRLEPSIVLCKEKGYFQAENIRTITIYTVVIVFLISSIIDIFYDTPYHLVIVFIISVFSLSGNKVVEQYLTEQEKYNEVSKNKVILGVITSSLHLLVAFIFGKGEFLLVYSYSISLLICNLYFLYKSGLKLIPSFIIVRPSLISEHKNFIRFELPSDFVFQLSQNLPILIIINIFGAEIAGLYSLAEKIILLPVSMIGSTLGMVYYREMSKDKSSATHSKETKLILNNLFVLVIIGIFSYYFFIDYLIGLFFNNEYVGLSTYTNCLILYGIVLFVSSPLSGALWKAGRQNVNLTISLVTFLLRCVTFYIVSINFSFDVSFLFLVIASILPRMLLFCFCMRFLSLKLMEIVAYNLLLICILLISYQVLV